MSTEAKESPLLGAVAKQRQVKTDKLSKTSVFYIDLYSVITSYRSPVNPIDNSKPVSGQ